MPADPNPDELIDYTQYVDFFKEFTLNELDIDEITLSICMIAITFNSENLNYIPTEFSAQIEEADNVLEDALWTQDIIDYWFKTNPLLLVLFPNDYITPEMQADFDSAFLSLTNSDNLPIS